MKVLVIAPEQLPIPPILGGSVETCIYQIFKRMAQYTHVTLLSRAHPNLSKISRLMGGNLKIIRIPFARREGYIKAALRSVSGESFDVIEIDNRPTFVPYVRKQFPRTRLMLALHSLTFMSRLSNQRANAILQQVNGITSVGAFVTQTMKKRFPLHAHKFSTTSLGVDTTKFRPAGRSHKLKLRKLWGAAGKYNVLFVGRMVPKKGLHTLVKAVALMKNSYNNTNLLAVGASWPGVKKETAYMRRVRLLSKRLGVRIRFTGYIPPAKVHQVYPLGDVFVCPTQYQEGFGMVNSEAMASGIPVIASNRGAIRELIRHGQSGLLVSDYNNPMAFAKAMKRVRYSPHLAGKLAINGRRRVIAKFSWDHTVRKLKKTLKVR